MRPIRRAFSLAEVMVACAVLLALLTGLYMLTTSGMRYFQFNRVHSETLLDAGKAMARVEEDLAGSARVSIAADDAPTPHCWMLSAEGFNHEAFSYGAAGQLHWKKRIGYFITDTDLIRTQIALTTEAEQSNPPPDPFPELADFEAVTGNLRTRVATHIARFHITIFAATSMVQIDISAEQQVASDRVTRVNLETQVKVENQ